MQSEKKQTEKYTLTLNNYNILKGLDLSEMGNDIAFYEEENSFKTSNVDLLMIILNEAICAYGLDENQECTEYGRNLYALYDEIYYQEGELL